MPRNKPQSGKSLTETHPELAAQAHGWDPNTIPSGSSRKLKWLCELGHEWEATVKNRSNLKSGCPVCANRSVLQGFNDLATTHPSLAKQAHDFDPRRYVAGSSAKLSWKCGVGHIWLSQVKDRVAGNGCPYCSNRKVLHGFNDLLTTHPHLASEADGWDPKLISFGSNKKVFWRCTLGHRWRTEVVVRTVQKSGCPVCSSQKLLVGFNDLATTNPNLAAEADGWDPTKVMEGSNKILNWRCKRGHTWKAMVVSRKRGRNCPVCSNQKVLPGFNDLLTLDPVIATQACGWDPSTVTSGSKLKRKWLCVSGHEWTATTNDRTSGHGCPVCSKTGFDPNRSGYLYFLDHFDLQMSQIGITNLPDDRLGRHKRRGWEVIDLRGPMDGHLTQKLETNCLHALEKRGAVLGHKAGIEKFDGYTEAWTKQSLTVTSIKQILDWVYEDEGNSAERTKL